jgi:t-SNARE complex subunit (syntaxin)
MGKQGFCWPVIVVIVVVVVAVVTLRHLYDHHLLFCRYVYW